MTSSRSLAVTLALLVASLSLPARAAEVEIASLAELEEYAAQSGNTVTMKPGVYRLIDHMPVEQMPRRKADKQLQFLTFSGSDNTFNLDGVTIELDTALRAALKPPIHTSEFVVSGSNNTLKGLTITNVGDGTSPGGALLEVKGDRNTLRDCTFRVRGSFPYGYGDLFGKGSGSVISHHKHSGVLVNGSDTRVVGCKLYMRSFGHGFFVQGGENHHFEDCYVEGEMRSTDDMLAETSGPAFDVGFRTTSRNRQGEHRVTPGYMKSLAEDGFRTYGQIKRLTFVNCTAKNMRGGFELRTNQGDVRLTNCTATGNERGFWVGGGAVVEKCKGDAEYGPLLFVEGDNATVDVALMPASSDKLVHAIATIHGAGHKVTITPWQDQQRDRPTPIRIGYVQPGAGEGMSPFGQRATRDVTLRNETTMPVVVGEQASQCKIVTRGEVTENLGKEIAVQRIEPKGE